jgi:hypothetical protein
MRLAHCAAQDDPARGAYARTWSLLVRQTADGGNRLMAVEPAAPGVYPQLLYSAQFVTATGFKDIWRFWHGV